MKSSRQQVERSEDSPWRTTGNRQQGAARSSTLVHLALVLVALSPMFLGGCDEPLPPEACLPQNGYFLSSQADLDRVKSVALVVLDSSTGDETIARDTTQAIYQSLLQRHLFKVTVVRKDDPALVGMDLTGRQPIKLAQMVSMSKDLHCDAILYGTLSDHLPHPRMKMSLRMQLLDLKRGKMVWGVDQVWDSTDKKTLQRMDRYYRHDVSRQFAPLDERMMTVSPHAFAKFVAYDVAGTLPSPPELDEQPNTKTDKNLVKK